MTTIIKVEAQHIHPNDEVVLEIVDDTKDGPKLYSEELLEVGKPIMTTIWDTRSFIISERKKV